MKVKNVPETAIRTNGQFGIAILVAIMTAVTVAMAVTSFAINISNMESVMLLLWATDCLLIAAFFTHKDDLEGVVMVFALIGLILLSVGLFNFLSDNLIP